MMSSMRDTSRVYSKPGIIGDPLPATREQGDAILDSLANSWAQAITELEAATGLTLR